jgi:hypothetical protein
MFRQPLVAKIKRIRRARVSDKPQPKVFVESNFGVGIQTADPATLRDPAARLKTIAPFFTEVHPRSVPEGNLLGVLEALRKRMWAVLRY